MQKRRRLSASLAAASVSDTQSTSSTFSNFDSKDDSNGSSKPPLDQQRLPPRDAQPAADQREPLENGPPAFFPRPAPCVSGFQNHDKESEKLSTSPRQAQILAPHSDERTATNVQPLHYRASPSSAQHPRQAHGKAPIEIIQIEDLSADSPPKSAAAGRALSRSPVRSDSLAVASTSAAMKEDAFQRLAYDPTRVQAGGEHAYYEEALVRFIAGDPVLRAYVLKGCADKASLNASIQRFLDLAKPLGEWQHPIVKIQHWTRSYTTFRTKLSARSQRTRISAWANPADLQELARHEAAPSCVSKWISLWHTFFCFEWQWPASAFPSASSQGQAQRVGVEPKSEKPAAAAPRPRTSHAAPSKPSPLVKGSAGSSASTSQPSGHRAAVLPNSARLPSSGWPSANVSSSPPQHMPQLVSELGLLRTLVSQQHEQITPLRSESFQQHSLLAQHSATLQGQAQQVEQLMKRTHNQTGVIVQQEHQLSVQRQQLEQQGETLERVQRQLEAFHASAQRRW